MEDKKTIREYIERTAGDNGLILTELAEDHTVIERDIKENEYNVLGLVYGGVLVNAADTAAGITNLCAGDGGPTLNGSIDYLRPTNGVKKIRLESRIVKHGRSISFIETDIFSDQNVLVAKARFTYFQYSR